MNLISMSYLISQVTDYLINHFVNFTANSVFEREIIYSFILDIYLIYLALKTCRMYLFSARYLYLS